MSDRDTRFKKLSDLGEFGLIDLLEKETRSPVEGVVKGIGDDTAVLRCACRSRVLFTTDMLVEGIHFTQKMPPRGIGHKAIAVNISDIAAMGGSPKFAVVSLGMPPSIPWPLIKDIYAGMRKTARQFGVAIVGGDTVKSPQIVINVALLGEARPQDVVGRDGARAGDEIFVTGPLGRSLESGWHLKFIPRVKESQYLVQKFKPTAMIDISDGLAADLNHVLKASRVGAVIEEALIPQRGRAQLKEALGGGEDFELLFTLSPRHADTLRKRKLKNMSFYRIGTITSDRKGLWIKPRDGKEQALKLSGYTHF